MVSHGVERLPSPPPDGRPATGEIDSDLAARVFRRAAEIDRDGVTGTPAALDEEALLEIGAEAGISREAVRHALAEHQAGMLERPDSDRRALVGQRMLVVQRVVTGPPDRVKREVSAFLARQLFERRRHTQRHSYWTPREGIVAEIRRTLGSAKTLSNVTGIGVHVSDAPAAGRDAVVVQFTAELASLRRGLGFAAGSGMAIGGGGAVAATVGALLAPEAALLSGLPLGGAVAAGSYYGAREAYRRGLEGVRLVLDGFLDGL